MKGKKQNLALCSVWFGMILIFIVCQVNAFSDYNDEPEINPFVENWIKNATLEQKIGQMLMIGFEGYTSTDFYPFQQTMCPGGIILFKKNIKNRTQLRQLINGVQTVAYQTGPIGMFVSVDLEGGRVVHLPMQVAKQKYLAAAFWGDLYRRDKNKAIQGILTQTEDISQLFKDLGFNMNLAPVLDLKNGSAKSIIGDRAFDEDPITVAELSKTYIRSLQEKGVITVVKHFPGHGMTIVDTHYELPSAIPDDDELQKHLYPFRVVVDDGVDVVMMSHLLFPEFDGFPASLSYYWVTRELRECLNFDGIIMTDALEMSAITKNYQWKTALITGINAGNDLILISSGEKYIRAAGEILLNAVNTGLISEERVNTSVRRILRVKGKYGIIRTE